LASFGSTKAPLLVQVNLRSGLRLINCNKQTTPSSHFRDNCFLNFRQIWLSVRCEAEMEKSMHMNLNANPVLRPTGSFIRTAVIRVGLAAGLALALSSQASAQYGGGGGGTGGGTSGAPGYTAPSGGYGSTGKAVGIGVGAAAGGAAVLFLALHHHGAITGCVRPGSDGLRLVDDKKNKSYTLSSDSIALKPGEIVQVKGKKSSDGGALGFQATKVVKSLGSCNVDSGVAASQATPPAQK
jgi:hypothetical protein